MKSNKIYVTEEMSKFLKKTLKSNLIEGSEFNRNKLLSELDKAVIMDIKDLPEDVVKLNSEVVLIDLTTKKTRTFYIVNPNEADIKKQKISITSPLGIALIGYRSGAQIQWELPNGIKKFKILSVANDVVKQPS